MTTTFSRLVWLVLLSCLFISPALRADSALSYRDGRMAYDRGDFAVALATWRRLAENGDARSQNALGDMYLLGEAGPRDHRAAATWFARAAEQGLALAQYNLATMYQDGTGVPRSAVDAHKWYSLAGALAGTDERRALAFGRRAMIERRMTDAELSAARRLAREWIAAPGRRKLRLRRRPLEAADVD